jgi:hypothetical protein
MSHIKIRPYINQIQINSNIAEKGCILQCRYSLLRQTTVFTVPDSGAFSS